MEEADSYDLESVQAKKAISYRSNNKNRKNSYIQSQSQSQSNFGHDLELQHQVTVAISDRNGLKVGVDDNDNNDEKKVNNLPQPRPEIMYDGDLEGYDEANETIIIPDDNSDDEDEDEDLDIYHNVPPPSSGPNHGSFPNLSRSRQNNNNNGQQRVFSEPRTFTPELELYGKGNDGLRNGSSVGLNSGSVPNLRYSNGVSANAMLNDDDSDDLYGKGANPLMSPGLDGNNNNIPTRRHIPDKSLEALYNIPHIEEVHDTEGSGDYEWIEQSLKVCDDIEWRKYLKNFKDNKVSDHRLGQLNENDWKDLIPKIGPRNEFKALWMQWQRQRAQSMHL